MAYTLRYRFEAFALPNEINRYEIESGEGDWVFVRRRHHALAEQINDRVMLFVYNDIFRRWDYIGNARPGGLFYNESGHGPFELSADGHAYHLKK